MLPGMYFFVLVGELVKSAFFFVFARGAGSLKRASLKAGMTAVSMYRCRATAETLLHARQSIVD